LKVFSKILYTFPHEEKGMSSRLVGVELVNGETRVIYYPKYRDIFQILQELFLKEETRYPQEKRYKGRRMLFEAITDIYNGDSIEEVCERYKLPSPHYPLPLKLRE